MLCSAGPVTMVTHKFSEYTNTQVKNNYTMYRT